MKKLIFVLGSQRSGTNALRRSLSLDPHTSGFNEKASDELYDNWELRPEPDIREFLHNQPSNVLLKPIKSVIARPLDDLLDEFSAYDLQVVWIYRDPVNVFDSRRRHWPRLNRIGEFVDEWNRVNGYAAESTNPALTIVRYEDLIDDRKLFRSLCRRLDIDGEYLFTSQGNEGYRNVDPDNLVRIRKRTKPILEALEARKLSTASP